MAKAVGFMRAVPVKPDGAVGSHDHHAVDYDGQYEVPGKIFKKEEDKERQHCRKHQEADEGDPVSPAPEDIHPGKGFRPKLFCSRGDEGAIFVFPTIRRDVEQVIDKRVLGH